MRRLFATVLLNYVMGTSNFVKIHNAFQTGANKSINSHGKNHRIEFPLPPFGKNEHQ